MLTTAGPVLYVRSASLDEFLKNTSSAAWWIGVVVVGVVLNLVSAYLKKPIDLILSAVSSRWRRRSESARRERVALIAKIRGDKSLQTKLLADEMRERLNAIWLCSTGGLGVLAPLIMPDSVLGERFGFIYWVLMSIIVFGTFLIFNGLLSQVRAWGCESLLSDALEE